MAAKKRAAKRQASKARAKSKGGNVPTFRDRSVQLTEIQQAAAKQVLEALGAAQANVNRIVAGIAKEHGIELREGDQMTGIKEGVMSFRVREG